MGSDDDIAEERLLRVIEKGERSGSTPSAMRLDSRGFLGRIRQGLARFYAKPVAAEDRALTALQMASSAAWLVLAAAALYLAYSILSRGETSRKKSSAYSSDAIAYAPAVEMPPFKIEEKMRPESEYLSPIRERDPFTGTSGVPEAVQEVQGPSAQETLQSMAQGLTVVGVNRGAVRDAIIEDTAQKRTFFVKNGDKIKEMTVKEIKHDTVVLTYEGEDLEIR